MVLQCKKWPAMINNHLIHIKILQREKLLPLSRFSVLIYAFPMKTRKQSSLKASSTHESKAIDPSDQWAIDGALSAKVERESINVGKISQEGNGDDSRPHATLSKSLQDSNENHKRMLGSEALKHPNDIAFPLLEDEGVLKSTIAVSTTSGPIVPLGNLGIATKANEDTQESEVSSDLLGKNPTNGSTMKGQEGHEIGS